MGYDDDDVPDYRVLVCEGPSCNPDVHDYDYAVPRLLISEWPRPVPAVSTIANWVRRLKHTTHVRATRYIYRVPVGYCHDWVCQECGHHRVI